MSYFDAIRENVYGHKKKLLFFIDRIEHLRKSKGLKPQEIEILDIGCGNGIQITLPIGEKGYSILGVDFHKPSIEYAQSVNKLNNVKFILGDFYSLTIENKFDVIILSDILEHLKDPVDLLLYSKALLKSDGIVLISIPNGYGPYEIENFFYRIFLLKAVGKIIMKWVKNFDFKKSENIVPYNHECIHLQFFGMKQFRSILFSSGYRITVFEKGCFICGNVSDILLSTLPFLINWNIKLGEILPYFFVSVWYFECKLNSIK